MSVEDQVYYKAKRTTYFDTKNRKPLYGVKVKLEQGGQWFSLAKGTINGRPDPLFFDLPCDAEGYAIACNEQARALAKMRRPE